MKTTNMKNLVEKLKINQLARPMTEGEVANTYPLSILSKWDRFRKKDYDQNLLNVPKSYPQIYVHIPFCSSGCSYCFYDTNVGKSVEEQKRYTDNLKKEMDLRTDKISSSVSCGASIYFGGGTPTRLNKNLLGELIDYVSQSFPLQNEGSFTVETSPETCTAEKVELLLQKGVNRISMGAQTLEDRLLKKLGRAHSSQQSLDAIKRLRESGIAIFNMDLIYGLPSQTESSFLSDVRTLVRKGVPEFTLYHLRINPSAHLRDYENDLEKQLSMFANARDFLIDARYSQTRPLHFVKKDYLAKSKKYKSAPTSDQRNNQRKGFVLGFGSSAVSQIGDYLFKNKQGLIKYSLAVESKKIPGEKQFKLSKRDNEARCLIQNLTQKGKLDIKEYQKRFGNLTVEVEGKLTKIRKLGFVESKERNKLKLTDEGWICADMIERYFYP
ncbi:coproporphyrinogen III oxidase family protein [Candidatus Pacearchaeota archaeon]|nr:coproporphyrinogen III oxidase family protein [Candidatus Pacearchaeota archaeon]